MAAMAETRMNLSALQQRDPYITGIVDTASQVALYSFNPVTNEWEKTDVEGTLFVYTRSAAPVNGFLILNRLGLNDLIEPINKNLEFQLQDPFLLYRNGNASIYGIWFYDKDECARIGQLMNSLVQIAIDAMSGQNQKQEYSRRERRASESEIKPEKRVPTTNHQTEARVTCVVESELLEPSGGGASGMGGVGQPSSGVPPAVNIMDLLSRARNQYDKTDPRVSPAGGPGVVENSAAAGAGQPTSIMHILNRARQDNLPGSGVVTKPRGSPSSQGSRDSPRTKNTKVKTPKKKGPKPMIDNPNAAATKSTNILKPLAVKARSSPGMEDTVTTPGATSISLDALFRTSSDPPPPAPDTHSVSPQPVMGMPPLLQRIMSQPGSSMLADIERQYPAQQSGSSTGDARESPTSLASVPKMPSPPRVVNAKWSHEPESPSTAIRRSLNILGPMGVGEEKTHADRSGDRSSGSGGAVEVTTSHQREAGVSTESQSKYSAARGKRTTASPVAKLQTSFAGASHTQSQQLYIKNGHVTSTEAVQQGGSAGNSFSNVDILKLSNMVLEDRLIGKGQERKPREREEQTSFSSSLEDKTQERRSRPELRLATTVAELEASSSSSSSKPELVTPQALLEKAAFPVFTSRTTPNTSAQLTPDGVLMTPMAFKSRVLSSTPNSAGTRLSDGTESASGGESDLTVNALTKQQLQQALIHLLKTDTQFLTSIHDAYVQSLNIELRNRPERL